jgi:membrane protein YqaA with SNARE-associated domain
MKWRRRQRRWRARARLLLRGMKEPAAELLLAVISFLNGSLAPLPAEALLVPLCVNRPDRWLRYAAIATLGGWLGGLVGYALGALAFEEIGRPLIAAYGGAEAFAALRAAVGAHAIVYVIAASTTPVPFKVVAIAAGATGVDFATFAITGAVGRAAGYMLVAGAAAAGRSMFSRLKRRTSRRQS